MSVAEGASPRLGSAPRQGPHRQGAAGAPVGHVRGDLGGHRGAEPDGPAPARPGPTATTCAMSSRPREFSVGRMSPLAVRSGFIDDAPADVTARLLRGEPVDPAQVYFRCLPSFETASPALAWINERLFAGSGVRHPDRVAMQFFELA